MDADSCGICFDSLQNGQPVRELHSGADWSHIFHDECIRGWINICVTQGRSVECPMCRAPLNADNLRAIPESFWKELKIVFSGSEIIIGGEIIRQFYMAYQDWLEYNRLAELDNLALAHYAKTISLLNSSRSSNGSRPLLSMGHKNFNNYLGSSLKKDFNNAHTLQRNTFRASSKKLNHVSERLLNNVIALMVLFSILNYLKLRLRRGGGASKNICVNDVCFSVPEEYECSVQEAFDNLKNGLSKLNTKMGGRTRKRLQNL